MTIQLASNALTTLAAVKDELSIDSADDSLDAWLTRQINAKSGLITKFLNRTLAKTDHEEGLRGFGMPRIAVRNPPILTLTAITVRDVGGLVVETVDPDDVTIEDGEFLFRAIGWPHTASLGRGASGDPLSGTEERAIVVEYTGGFVLPKDDSEATPRTLPWEIEEACIAEVAARYGRKGGFQAASSERAFSHSVTFRGYGKSGLLPETEAALMQWRRVAQA